MINFKVAGPIKIPYESKRNVKRIDADSVKEIWESNYTLKDKKGCYVFAIRAGGGFTPYYVGKTKVSFENEAFIPRNIVKFYNSTLFEYDRGRPVMFFVYIEGRKGPTPDKVIQRVEKFLIDLALQKNPDLKNKSKTKQEKWLISGVVRGGKGSKVSKNFKVLMGLD